MQVEALSVFQAQMPRRLSPLRFGLGNFRDLEGHRHKREKLGELRTKAYLTHPGLGVFEGL